MRLEHYPAEKLKSEILEIIAKHLDLSKYRVFFFGSRVTGKGTDRSDIDVGIEGLPIPARAWADIQEELENFPSLYKIEIVDFRTVAQIFRDVALENTETISASLPGQRTKYEAVLQEFRDAVERFGEVLREPKNEFIRDSAIKRFEIVFDLSWKTIEAGLEDHGATCTSPLGCFKEAYRQSLIDYEEIWVELVKTQNKTAHTYSQKIAEEVYSKLPESLTAFQKLADALRISAAER